MKLSDAWLREWVKVPITTKDLGEQLTMAGHEVASITQVAEHFEGVVVGAVLSVEAHPNAQKLHLCRVDVGGPEPLQIVCGAANVAPAMRVPTALLGANLPNGIRIKEAKLRGVESFGMLCSAEELGLAETSSGLMPLPPDAPIGKDIREYLALDDQIIELELTPDRGDCLSVRGIARELGVINRLPVTEPAIPLVVAEIDQQIEVHLQAPKACPRYACRIIRDIDPKAETPVWMRERLRRSGMRSLGPLVDVTNYVMLEFGQPLHAFDLEQLQGAIQVRLAHPGERLHLLDGQEIELRPDSLVIADAHRALALAGIMGGEGSGISAGTRHILLESAFFHPTEMIGKPRSYGLHTESSHRFERGVDPGLQVEALERATALLLSLSGGAPGPVVDIQSCDHLPQRPKVRLRSERIERLLGVSMTESEIEDILRRLGMEVIRTSDSWLVSPPSCRFDIGIEADLIEELGRIYGYSNIPMARPRSHSQMSAPPEASFDLERAKGVLVDRDYHEVITYSFVDPQWLGWLDPQHQGLTLSNPIASDMSVMRTTLWVGLLQAARYNQARQQGRIRLFESGLRFIQQADGLHQENMLAGLAMGAALPEQWAESQRLVDFFDIKADLEAIFGLTGAADEFVYVAARHPALHPGQSARLMRKDLEVGWIGTLHPELERRLDLAGPVLLFELDLQTMMDGRVPSFQPLSKFPAIRRDLAILLDQEIAFAAVREVILSVPQDFLQEIRLFDLYRGEKIDLKRKSLALGLIFQATSRTLRDEEVEAYMDAVVQNLSSQLGAKIRE